MSYQCKNCKRKFISQEFLDKHLALYPKDAQLKRKGWVTPYGFVDLKEPVTYEEALEMSKALHDAFNERKKNEEIRDNTKV